MDNSLILFGLVAVILAWLCVIWYLYRMYSSRGIKRQRFTGYNGGINRSLNISKDKNIDQNLGESEHAQKIIENAVSDARRTLEDTEYFKKDIAEQIEKSLREVEENTSRLLEGESEALDQQYKSLLSQMQEAIVKARETLINTEYIREDFIREIEANLQKVGLQLQENLKQQSDAMTSQYQQLFKNVEKDYLKESEKSVKSFEQVAEKQLNDFHSALKQKTIGSQDEIEKMMKERFQSIQQELEAYRADQMKRISEQTTSILEIVAKRVLGQSLNMQQQEALVLEALEEAKRESLFKE